MVQMECNQMYHLNWNITCAVALGSTHTHTHTFNGPLSGTTQVSRYQKGKTTTTTTV